MTMYQRISGPLVLAWGWRRALIATGAGALAALSQAPFNAFAVLWVSLPALVFLLDGTVGRGRGRAAFGVGWCFGAGYGLAGLWWVSSALLVDAAQFGWLIPFALAGLSAGLGLFYGLGTWLARLFWSEGPVRILALAAGLAASEWLRGHVLTGFPWNALGYGLAANDALMQAASLVGIEGLTLLAVIVFAAPALLIGDNWRDRAAGLAGLALFGAIWGFGLWRLSGATGAEVPNVKLRIMQPAIDQYRKWKPEFRQEIMARYASISAGPDGKALDGVTHLIWPESAFPFLLAQESWALATLSDLLPKGTTLLTGAVRAEPPAAGETRPHYYNSVYAIGDDARILAAYDKVHLVPFGEYLPVQSLLESFGLRQLTQVVGGFSTGPGLRSLDVPGAPRVGPLICYEAIFPHAVVDDADRPGWLLNVTNDGWFGLTPGPHQHFQQVRLRAVEEGLPVVRSANSGISAVIDGYGRIIAKLDLGEAGALNAPLPVALAPTFNAHHRYAFLWLLFLVSISLLMSRISQFHR